MSSDETGLEPEIQNAEPDDQAPVLGRWVVCVLVGALLVVLFGESAIAWVKSGDAATFALVSVAVAYSTIASAAASLDPGWVLAIYVALYLNYRIGCVLEAVQDRTHDLEWRLESRLDSLEVRVIREIRENVAEAREDMERIAEEQLFVAENGHRPEPPD